MTAEEAIRWIGAIKEKYIHGGDEWLDEMRKCALDMAIAALRAQAEEKNEPLTLEGLREMYGEPVWVEFHEMGMAHLSGWGIRNHGFAEGYHTNYSDEDYGKTWLAYRRKPEEAPADG